MTVKKKKKKTNTCQNHFRLPSSSILDTRAASVYGVFAHYQQQQQNKRDQKAENKKESERHPIRENKKKTLIASAICSSFFLSARWRGGVPVSAVQQKPIVIDASQEAYTERAHETV